MTSRLMATPEGIAYNAMLGRCYRSNNASYYRYGRRGIRVCNRWLLSFQDFLLDMGLKPSSSHSLDRLDNSKGYSPDNCRWATPEEQCCNRDSSHLIEYNGKSQTISRWSRDTGLSKSLIRYRLG